MEPEDLVDAYNKEVASFFEVEPLANIQIVLFDTQKDIIDFYNNNRNDDITAPNYLVGFSPENFIYIVRPEGMPSDSDTGPARFQKVLKHELVHKYLKNLCNKSTPSWLVEGTCTYLAKQNKNEVNQKDISIDLLNNLGHTQDGRKYSVGNKMVCLIISEFGKDKLFELIRIESTGKRNAELQKMFVWLS